MKTSSWHGNKIIYLDNEWVYADTKEPVERNPNRACGYCGKEQTDKGYDGCLGHIPAVQNACCGHGKIREMYIQFKSGRRISGRKAMRWLRERYRPFWGKS